MPSSQSLLCHPATPPQAVRRLDVTVEWCANGELRIRYAVHGDIERLAIPVVGSPARCDRLWEQTCFELFVAGSGTDGYREFNFSPSSAWACYAFTAYRQGMSAPPVSSTPRIHCNTSPGRLDVLIQLRGVPDVCLSEESPAPRLGLSAVLAEDTGTKSYWALRHSAGEPDFHDPASFLWVLDRVSARGAVPAGQLGEFRQSEVDRVRKSV